MANTYFKSWIDRLLQESKHELDGELEVGGDRVCSICGSDEVDLEELQGTGGTDFYEVSCLDCEQSTAFYHMWIQIKGDFTHYHEAFTEDACRKCGRKLDLDAIVNVLEPVESEVRTVAVYPEFNNVMHEHHVSYEPEETVTVCAKCHRRIHTDESYHPELTPEMSRSEYRETKKQRA